MCRCSCSSSRTCFFSGRVDGESLYVFQCMRAMAGKSGPRHGTIQALSTTKSSSTHGMAEWQHGNQPLRIPPSNRSMENHGDAPSPAPALSVQWFSPTSLFAVCATIPRNETLFVRFWLKGPSQRWPPIQPFSSSYAAKEHARKHESPLAERRFHQALILGV